jgi:flagellar basal-body rod modification protein FlgD
MSDVIQSSLLGLPGLGSVSDSTTKTAASNSGDLGQDDFLRLMTTQLAAQDPFEPMDSSQFLSQFAQFGTVSGIQALQESFDGLSNSLQSLQALQASTLVGRTVLVDGNSTMLSPGGSISGTVSAADASNVVLSVYNTAGVLMHQDSLTTDSDGETRFDWNGVTDSGPAPAGTYRVSAQGSSKGDPIALSTQVVAAVDSVTVGRGGIGLTLNLAGAGSVAAGDVIEIRQ